jgi:hypothetical protein
MAPGVSTATGSYEPVALFVTEVVLESSVLTPKGLHFEAQGRAAPPGKIVSG